MGEGGFDGWLEWLGTTNTTGFVALIKSMIPHQVNLRTEKGEPEKYRTVEEIEADLRAGGYSDEKIAFLIEDLRPQNKVSAVPLRKFPTVELDLTEITDLEIEPRLHLPVGILGKTNSAGLSYAF